MELDHFIRLEDQAKTTSLEYYSCTQPMGQNNEENESNPNFAGNHQTIKNLNLTFDMVFDQTR